MRKEWTFKKRIHASWNDWQNEKTLSPNIILNEIGQQARFRGNVFFSWTKMMRVQKKISLMLARAIRFLLPICQYGLDGFWHDDSTFWKKGRHCDIDLKELGIGPINIRTNLKNLPRNAKSFFAWFIFYLRDLNPSQGSLLLIGYLTFIKHPQIHHFLHGRAQSEGNHEAVHSIIIDRFNWKKALENSTETYVYVLTYSCICYKFDIDGSIQIWRVPSNLNFRRRLFFTNDE